MARNTDTNKSWRSLYSLGCAQSTVYKFRRILVLTRKKKRSIQYVGDIERHVAWPLLVREVLVLVTEVAKIPDL
jgi:hypothetical protein